MERVLRSCGVGLILGLVLACGPAKAASHSFGNIMPGEIPGDFLVVLSLDSGLDTVFDGGVAFEDQYYFDLVDAGTPGLTVSVLFEVENAVDAQAVVPLSVQLYKRESGGDTLLASATSSQTITFTRLLATSLTAEDQYLLTIAGTAPAELTAGYSGTMNVTAVPEPSTVVLLLAGLSLLTTAFRATHRSQRLPVRSR